jgi:hypothetical protein
MSRPHLHLVQADDEQSGMTPEIEQALARAAESIRVALVALASVQAAARYDAENRIKEATEDLERALRFCTYDFDAMLAECNKVPIP